MEGDFCCLFSLSEEVVYSKLFHRDGLKSRLVLILLHYRYTSATFSTTVNKGCYGAANVCPCVLHMHTIIAQAPVLYTNNCNYKRITETITGGSHLSEHMHWDQGVFE